MLEINTILGVLEFLYIWIPSMIQLFENPNFFQFVFAPSMMHFMYNYEISLIFLGL